MTGQSTRTERNGLPDCGQLPHTAGAVGVGNLLCRIVAEILFRRQRTSCKERVVTSDMNACCVQRFFVSEELLRCVEFAGYVTFGGVEARLQLASARTLLLATQHTKANIHRCRCALLVTRRTVDSQPPYVSEHPLCVGFPALL